MGAMAAESLYAVCFGGGGPNNRWWQVKDGRLAITSWLWFGKTKQLGWVIARRTKDRVWVACIYSFTWQNKRGKRPGCQGAPLMGLATWLAGLAAKVINLRWSSPRGEGLPTGRPKS
ncbi:hypothetical protein MCOR02_008650 [Pyricularia oryzae]|nr:hypothetical protein MCOR02_008650 [Pyricularia oryzae]KAI6468343.1 hypothetical protein MCOR17_004160 [Pyricularia oryzae]